MEAAGIPVWRDVRLLPGEEWKREMQRAITDGAFAFVACFSSGSLARAEGRQNEELILAIEQMRARLPGEPWLILVRLDDCLIPDLEIGAGRTLRSLRPADLFGERADIETERLITSILRILGGPVRQAGPPGRPDGEPSAGQGPTGTAASTSPARGTSMWQRFMSWDVAIRAALIGGACVIVAGLVPYLLGAYSGTPRPGRSPSADSSRSPSPAFTTSPELTAAQKRLIDCQALTTDAADESTELLALKNAIFVDDPTSRVTGHTASFAASYSRTLAIMQLIIARKDRFENEGGTINVDPKLDGDLNDMSSDLYSLREAVVNNGIGGPQWNQLSSYAHDFSLLAGLKCVG